MTDVAKLDLKVDATQPAAAAVTLDQLTAAAIRADTATAQLGASVVAAEAALRADASTTAYAVLAKLKMAEASAAATAQAKANADAIKLANSATMSYKDAMLELTAAMATGEKVSRAAREALGGVAGVLAASKGLSNDAALGSVAVGKGLGEVEKAASTTGKAVAGGSVQLGLFTRELAAAGREIASGRFTRLPSTLALLAQSTQVGSAIIQAALSSAGLVVIATTAAFAGLFAIMAKGENQFTVLQGQLKATGDYAGLTATSYTQMAEEIAHSQNVTIGSTKSAISELIASGKFTGETIKLVVENAQAYSKLTGEDAGKIVKNYEEMSGGVVKWAVTHEEQYHDLSLAQIDHIQTLEKEGKHEQAILDLQTDIHKAVGDRIQDYGLLQNSLHDVATWASTMWDKILGVGRPKTLGEQLTAATAQLAGADTAYNRGDAKGQQSIAFDKQRVENLKGEIDMQQQAAAAQAKKAQAEDDAIRKKYDNRAKKFKSPKVDKAKTKLEELAAEAAGNRDLAQAYDVSTAAGFRAAAMKAGQIDAARLHGNVSAFEAAELEKAVTAQEVDTAKYIQGVNLKIAQAEKILPIMQATGESQASANKTISDGAEIQKTQAALLNATGADAAVLRTQLEELTAAQDRLNKVNGLVSAQEQINAQQKINDQLDIELNTVNETNRARAVELAFAKSMAAFKKDGVDFTSPTGQTLIKTSVAGANKQQDLNSGLNDTLKQQQFYLNILNEMAARTKTAASDMAASFGTVGKALGDLTSVTVTYYDDSAKADLAFNQQVKAANGDQVKIDALTVNNAQAKRDAELKYYGDVAGAASQFFGKNTAAYKVLHATEEAYRVFEFAASVQSIAVKAAETGSKVALFEIQTVAAIQAGAANMFATLGPFGFAAVAGMLAVMVGLGFKGTHGSAGGVNDAKANQASQGTGSVFGDSSAKSASITNSVAIASANQNTLLDLTQSMANSLHSIEDNISTVANALITTFSGSGALSASSLNVGNSTSGPGLLQKILNPLSALLPGLFGSSTATKLTGQGLNFGPQSIGDILSGGISGNTFAQTTSETKKKFFGITYSDKTSTNNYSGALDDQLKNELTTLIGSLRGGVLAAAGELGVTGAAATIDSFKLNIGKIDLTGLTGAQINDALNAVFSKAADDISVAVLPMVQAFAKAGEGAFQTLVRVATDYQVVDTTLASIGLTFKTVGLDSIAAREDLVNFAGGLNNLTSQASFYAKNFLTAEQQLAPVQAAVTKQMTALGLSGITTKAQFVDLVNSLDVSTTAGAKMYDALLLLAPAFSAVTDGIAQNITTLTTAVNDNQSKLQLAYETASKPLQALVTTYSALVTSLSAYQDKLKTGPQAALSPIDQYNATKAAFEANNAAVASGDQTALANQPTVDDAFLAASQAYFATSSPYFQDLDNVKASVASSLQFSKEQVSVAQQQQNALDTIVNAAATENNLLFSVKDGVFTVNKSVLSVVDAIHNLNLSTAALATATAPPPVVAPVTVIPAPVAGPDGGPDHLTGPDTPAGGKLGNTGTPTIVLPTPQEIQDTINKYIQDGGVFAGGGRGGSDYGGIVQQYAKGGVFTNGVVSQPTLFNNSRMGESGSEAIVPLVRTAEGLGVRSVGSNDNGALAQQALLTSMIDQIRIGNLQRGNANAAIVNGLSSLREEFNGLRREVARNR